MILRGSRYETAAVLRVAGRPVKIPFTHLDAVLYLRERRHQPKRVPVPTQQVQTRSYYPTVYPARTPGQTVSTRVVSYTDVTLEMGDRLQDIAFKQYGDATLWHLLATANPDLFDPDDLPVGANLKVPTLASTRRVAAPATSPRVLTTPFSGLR